MSGDDFEEYLAQFFRRKGFGVEQTPVTGDYGVDLILTNPRSGERIAVQAKRYSPSRQVGIAAVQEVYAGKDYYNCTRAIVVTTATFSPNAKTGAERLGVWLIDREDLQTGIEQGGSTSA